MPRKFTQFCRGCKRELPRDAFDVNYSNGVNKGLRRSCRECRAKRHQVGIDADRFWSKVDRSGGPDSCWVWQGSSRHGYGSFSIKDAPKTYHTESAHRVAWQIERGDIPSGMLICHRCDNRRCCNPDHLFIGTYADNNRDCRTKGRARGGFDDGRTRGEQSFVARLTTSQVMDIRRAYVDTDIPMTKLAKQYSVGSRQLYSIVNGESWRHLPMPSPSVPPDEADRIRLVRHRRGRPRKHD